MSRWTVEVIASARREIRRLDEGPQREAGEIVEDLMEDPELLSASKMEGYQNRWKVRFYQGQYRFIFDIARAKRHIRVIRVRPRSTAYEGLKQRS